MFHPQTQPAGRGPPREHRHDHRVRVLNHPNISEGTRARVEAAIEQLGDIPDVGHGTSGWGARTPCPLCSP
ncbi:hypothetical protein [Deinococcus sp.]|uniref:hypothetical protein n=1 Tax=Deinococcus sp. TaxID=47478 RepID=UPI002869BA50|nr:hypothetical protein [Deinococcus sp.]